MIKRNQLIITAMATLVAIAGYVSFGDTSQASKKENVSNAIEAEGNVETTEGEKINVGEAVLVSADGGKNSLAEAKLEKQYMRAQLSEELLKIIENVDIEDDVKRSAIDKYTDLSSVAEKEVMAENEIRLRGYDNCVVTKIDDKVQALIINEAIEISELTKIEDALKDIFSVPLKNITITVVDNNESNSKSIN